MKADNKFETTGHNRFVKFTGIDTRHCPELTVELRYRIGDNAGPAVLDAAITLDNIIVPLIVELINKHDAKLKRKAQRDKRKALKAQMTPARDTYLDGLIARDDNIVISHDVAIELTKGQP